MAQLPEINAGDLIRFYFRDAGEENSVFLNAAEERQGFSRFADLLCALLLVLEEAESPFSFERIGSLFRNAGAAKALEPRGETVFPEKERLRGIWEELLRKSAGLPLGKILNDSRLEPLEKTAFFLAFLVQRSRKYERLFGELQEQEEGIIYQLGYTQPLVIMQIIYRQHFSILLFHQWWGLFGQASL